MDEKQLIVQLQRLTSITDKEWIVVAKRCKAFLRSRLKNKTGWGVHSESSLGVNAFDFYFVGAVEKLYAGTCTWFFERFDITEQIIRIMNSMISENIRKSDTFIDVQIEIEYDTERVCSCKEIDEEYIDEDEYNGKLQIVKNIIQDNEDLITYFNLVQEGYNSKEISLEMNLPISKVYKLTEKIKTLVLKELSYAK